MAKPSEPKIPKAPESAVQTGSLKVCRKHLGKDNIERQNTGGMYDPRGQFVRYGKKGNSDITGQFPQGWGDATGKKLDIECKKEGWKPPRPPGPHEPGKPAKPKSKARAKWEPQLARLRRTNENGGYAFWTDDPTFTESMLLLIRRGYRVEIGDDEYPMAVEPEGE